MRIQTSASRLGARLLLLGMMVMGGACGEGSVDINDDGGQNPDGGPRPEPSCERRIDPAAFSVDVPLVKVQGRITVAGAAAASRSGSVSLRGAAGDSLLLGRTGDASYSERWIIPGTYDVVYSWDQSDAMADVPRNNLAVIRAGVAISASGVLDVDIPVVKLDGRVTAAGKTPTSRSGSVSLRSASGDSLLLGRTGDASYSSKLVVPGTYDITYSWDQSDAMADVPRNSRATLRSGVSLMASGVLDVDIPVVKLDGRVTAAGMAPTSRSGSVSLRSASGDSLLLGRTGDASYSSKLVVPGTYDITYGWDQSDAMADVPRNSRATLRSGVSLMASGVLDVDIPVVKLDGRVTVAGKTPASRSGSVSLRSASGDSLLLGRTGDPNYASKLLVPGTYDITYNWDQSDAMADLPRNSRATLRSGVSLMASGVLDVDIPVVKLDGRVTVNGRTPTSKSGSVSLRNTKSGDSLLLGRTGDPNYASKLLVPGTYEVFYSWDQSDAMADLPRNSSARLRSAVEVASTGVLDVDIPAVTVVGRITTGGQTSKATSGAVTLRNQATGDSVRLGRTGEASYAPKLLVPAAYDIFYGWDQSDNLPDVPRNRSAQISCAVVPAAPSS